MLVPRDADYQGFGYIQGEVNGMLIFVIDDVCHARIGGGDILWFTMDRKKEKFEVNEGTLVSTSLLSR